MSSFSIFFVLLSFLSTLNCKIKDIKDDSETEKTNYTIIVIGAGISGLSAASLLSQMGKDVLVLEQGNIGGVLQTFTRVGKYSKNVYHFDVGMHFLGNQGKLLFDFVSGTQTFDEFNPISELYLNRTTNPDIAYKWPELMEQIIEKYPEHKEKVELFFKGVRNPKNKTKNIVDFAREDCEINDPNLLWSLVHQCAFCDMSLFKFFFDYYFVSGSVFPRGGSDSLINGAVKKIESKGGKVVGFLPAEKLILNEKKKAIGVKTKKGNFYAQAIISTMSVYNTINKNFIDEKVLNETGYTREIRNQYTPGGSFISYYMGFNATPEEIGVTKANFVYWGYNPQDKNSVVTKKEQWDINVFSGSSISQRDVNYHDNFGSGTVVFAMQDAHYWWFQAWHNGTISIDNIGNRHPKYYEKKQKFIDSFLEKFFTIYPNAKKYLEVIECGTPLTTMDYLNQPRGQAYGANRKLSWFKYKSNIPGLYMAGQEILALGVYPSLGSGLIAGLLVMKDYDLVTLIIFVFVLILLFCLLCGFCVIIFLFIGIKLTIKREREKNDKKYYNELDNENADEFNDEKMETELENKTLDFEEEKEKVETEEEEKEKEKDEKEEN